MDTVVEADKEEEVMGVVAHQVAEEEEGPSSSVYESCPCRLWFQGQALS